MRLTPPPGSGHKIKIRIPSADLPAPLGRIIQCTLWYLIKRSGHYYTRTRASPTRRYTWAAPPQEAAVRRVSLERICDASDSWRFDLRSQTSSCWLSSVLVEAEVLQCYDLDIMQTTRNISKQTLWMQHYVHTFTRWRSFSVQVILHGGRDEHRLITTEWIINTLPPPPPENNFENIFHSCYLCQISD